MTLQDLADVLRNVRVSAGLTQRDVAERVGVHHQVVSRYEHGDGLESVLRFAEFIEACGFTLSVKRSTDPLNDARKRRDRLTLVP